MTRGRRSSSASSGDDLSRSRSRSRPATFRQRSQSRPGSARSKSRGPSPRSARSKSRGPPLSRRLSSSASTGQHDDPPTAKKDATTSGPGVKGSLVFLGTIAAAAYTAHKVWPKGVLYGHKEDWEAEHHEAAVLKKKSRKAHHRERDDKQGPAREERGRPAPPRHRDGGLGQDDRSEYVTSKSSPRDAPPPAWAESRPRVFESAAPASGRFSTTGTSKPAAAPFTSIPFDSDRHSQSTGSGSGSGTSPRKYLPYEPGVYTPSSVASSRLFERERPTPLPLERQRGLPFVPAAPARRFYEDEGYGSGEPVTRSSRYQDLDDMDYRR